MGEQGIRTHTGRCASGDGSEFTRLCTNARHQALSTCCANWTWMVRPACFERCACLRYTIHRSRPEVICSPSSASAYMRVPAMREVLPPIFLDHPRMVFTLTPQRRWIFGAHRPRTISASECAQELRGCQCATASRKLPAGSGCAVPKGRPRHGPKSVPPNDSKHSCWNRIAGQIVGSIGGFSLLQAMGVSCGDAVNAQQPCHCVQVPWREKVP